jgi:hypothetical protein
VGFQISTLGFSQMELRFSSSDDFSPNSSLDFTPATDFPRVLFLCFLAMDVSGVIFFSQEAFPLS